MKKILLLIPFLLMLCGCYDYKELNDLSIVTALSIESNSNNYNLTVQIVNPKKEQDTSSSDADYITFDSKATTLEEAYKFLTKKSIKNIYETQIQLIIIDEDIAKKRLKNVVEFLVKNTDIRNEVYVLIGRDKNILKDLTPLNNISSKNIIDSLNNYNNSLSYSKKVTLSDLIKNYQNETKEIIMPSIKLTNNKVTNSKDNSINSNIDNTSAELSELAIFKNNKLVGYLSNDEALAFNFITNNINSAIIRCENKDNYILSEITKVTSKIKIIPDDKKIYLVVDGSATIVENSNNINNNDYMYKVEKMINSNIESLIVDSYNNINNKYNSDIYGLKDMYYKKYGKKRNIINNYKIDVSSNIKLTNYNNVLGGNNYEQ